MTTYNRDWAYHTIFVTALEGGIGYWSTCSKYHWRVKGTEAEEDLKGFFAVIRDTEDEDATDQRVDRAVIAKGVGPFQEWARNHPNDYYMAASRDLRNGKWDELDVDAEIADMIVQFGLFGKVVYG